MRTLLVSPAGLSGLLVLTTWGCSSNDDDAADAAQASGACPESETYCHDDQWLCRPGLERDYCLDETTLTVIAEDGSESVETLEPADDPSVDCFYVYPTVLLTFTAGLAPDYSNLDDILTPLRLQAQPFSSVCRVFAPLYHQVSIGSYTSPQAEELLDQAFEDVLAAFEVYLEHYNDGRDFVLLGHSQGTHMLMRLISRRVETDDALLSRMVAALPIGGVGRLTVPTGEPMGGSFEKVPTCTSKAERGCFITWDSGVTGAADGQRRTDGAETPCVNPASFDDREARLAGSYFVTRQHATGLGASLSPDYPTTFVVLRDAYTGRCVPDSSGQNLLEIAFSPLDGDVRSEPISLGGLPNLPGFSGMHLLDYTFPLEDLLVVTQAKIDAGN